MPVMKVLETAALQVYALRLRPELPDHCSGSSWRIQVKRDRLAQLAFIAPISRWQAAPTEARWLPKFKPKNP